MTLTMLRSFVYFHENAHVNLWVSENSTNEETIQILSDNGIKHIRNPGATHSEGMNQLFNLCETEFALLLDTDIIFTRPIQPYLEFMKLEELTLFGEYQHDRGKKKLYPRIAPWFCLVNMSNLRRFKIPFNDTAKMLKHNLAFDRKYDVGSTMFEEVTKHGLRVNDIGEEKRYVHYEGMSWHTNKYSMIESNIDAGGTHSDKNLYKLGESKLKIYLEKEVEKFKDVSILNQFN